MIEKQRALPKLFSKKEIVNHMQAAYLISSSLKQIRKLDKLLRNSPSNHSSQERIVSLTRATPAKHFFEKTWCCRSRLASCVRHINPFLQCIRLMTQVVRSFHSTCQSHESDDTVCMRLTTFPLSLNKPTNAFGILKPFEELGT